MKTKQKIINQAITSYNSNGLTNITSRDLAKSLNISHGNLEYHFKNKETLLTGIYVQMKNDISGIYENNEFIHDPFTHFNELLIQLEKFHKTYSFFNLDVLEISRNYPGVKTLLDKSFQVRKEQTAYFYKRFKAYSYLKEEIVTGQYLRLQHTIRILITFWNSQQEILPYSTVTQNSSMATYIWELLIPHMTEKGYEVYQKLTKG